MTATAGRRHDPEHGGAVVEFVLLVTVLLVPVTYLALVLGRLEAAAYAADAGAREAARMAASAADDRGGRAAARAAVVLTAADQGFEPAAVHLDLDCAASPCATPGAAVRATVTVRVDLPGVPAPVLGGHGGALRLRARALAVADRFGAAP